jgi:hypothetical protein
MSVSVSRRETLNNLKELEKQNINQRVLHFVNAVNERVRSKFRNNPPLFDPHMDVSLYVDFIDKFHGARVRELRRVVFSMGRAKKWLDSKRAMMYSKTLFVEFLLAIEQFSSDLAGWQEPVMPKTRFNLMWMWRFDLLSAVLKGSYLPHNPHASVKPLICANTLKYKSKFKIQLMSWGLDIQKNTSLDELASQSQIKAQMYYNIYLKLKQPENTTSFCSNQLNDEVKETLPIIENDYLELQQRCNKLKEMNILLQGEINKLQHDFTQECEISAKINEVHNENLRIRQRLFESQIIVPNLNIVDAFPQQTLIPPEIENLESPLEFMSVDENVPNFFL